MRLDAAAFKRRCMYSVKSVFPFLFHALVLPTASLLALVACSSTSPASGTAPNDAGTAPAATGTVGDTCAAGAPCRTGLTCAQSGDLKGRCTADCTADLGLCAKTFGASAVCMNASECARTCTSASDCPGAGQCVSLSSGKSACISNPNGAPDAAPPPNGACVNLGGAFGDTVANRGYRCTPSSTGGLRTGIDQCKNGVWVSAYTCTCQVTFGGASDPSQCFDITAADTAQCSYGLTSCAACDPATGCRTQ